MKVSARLLGAKRFNKERFQLAKKLRSARCSPFVISKVLAARIIKLITACARKNKRTARMLANARKDHSIPLNLLCFRSQGRYARIKAGYQIKSLSQFFLYEMFPLLMFCVVTDYSSSILRDKL